MIQLNKIWSFVMAVFLMPTLLQAGSNFSLDGWITDDASIGFVVLGAFLAGVLASFTPCIYPMIPITISLINGQKTNSMVTSFFLSVSYALGIASVYAGLGYASAKSGLIFGQWLSNPIVIGLLLLLFVYLAFAMFGFYEMYVPTALTQSSGTSTGGSFVYSYFFGAISGAAASPCLTPALALLLGFVSKQGNPLVGLAVLFSFAIGMSLLLIVVGTFSSSLNLLPRAGGWMIEVKRVFGFMLLAVCVYFLEPFVEPEILSLGYAIVAIAACAYYIYLTLQQKKVNNMVIPALLVVVTAGLAKLLLFDAYLEAQEMNVIDWVVQQLK